MTPELIAPGEVHVYVFPVKHPGKSVPEDVVAVVVGPHKGKGLEGVIQPTRTEQITTEYKNLMGATFEGQGLKAVFPLSVLTENNEFRVMFTGAVQGVRVTEEKAMIKMKDIK